MSARHPIISITGSSGAGTTSVKQIFEHIFRREKIEAAFIEGDAFHRYDRAAEVFTRLATNSQDAEIQFALGSLMRKRGEVDRAIAIHMGLAEHRDVRFDDVEAGHLRRHGDR